MAFPSVQARTTTQNTAAAATHSVSLGSPSAGELIVVVCSFAGNPTITIDKSVSGTGWWLVGQGDGSTSLRVAVFAKIAEGSDALTLALNSSQRLAALTYRFSGHGSAVSISTIATASSTNGNPAAVTQSGAAQDTLFLAALATVSSVASGAPSGYGTLTTASATSTFVSVAEKTANATIDDPGTFTNTNQRHVVLALAIGSEAVTTALRASQVVAETLSTPVPALRISQIVIEMLSTNVADGLPATGRSQAVICG